MTPMKIDIAKSRGSGQGIEFKAVWTWYEDFPVKTITPMYDADNNDCCWGVHLPNCKSQDMVHYMEWCDCTFGDYEIDGHDRKFWFKEEKHRTMFLLRWS